MALNRERMCGMANEKSSRSRSRLHVLYMTLFQQGWHLIEKGCVKKASLRRGGGGYMYLLKRGSSRSEVLNREGLEGVL